MKRVIILLLCAVLTVSMCACTQKPTTATSYDDLIYDLEVAVNAMFTKGFESKVAEGSYPSPTGEHEDKWCSMLLDATKDFGNIDENAFGYRLIDINSDSAPELIFCRSDEIVLAVFTLHAGKVTMVDAFNRSYRCVIRDTGELYTLTVREDGGYDHKISVLDPSEGVLYTTVSFGMEGTICYEMIEGSVYTTSAERIAELKEEYPHTHGEAVIASEFNLF